MMRIVVFGLMLAFAAAASAQLYKWTDKDGRVRYTDRPPPAGTKARTIATPSSAPAAAAQDTEAAKDGAPQGALTPEQQEQAFRKRQLDAQKAAEKSALAGQEEAAKRENCARAREYQRTLESGQRVSRTNAQGEREYIDDATRDREVESARKAVTDWCG
jgi:hypothetical protein